MYNSTFSTLGFGDYQEFKLVKSLHADLNTLWKVFITIFAIYLTSKYTYRVYFHKLSGIPGPPLAAASHLYEAYLNIIADGYFKRLLPMHRHYNSPVVRIGTNHVHVGDPQYYHTIYNSGSDFIKAGEIYEKLGIDGSMLTICDPEEHRQYRSIVVSLFSRKASDDVVPIMGREIRKAAQSMAGQCRTGTHTVICRVFRALAADMTSQLVLGKPLGLIDTVGVEADHYHDLMRSVDAFTRITWFRIYYRVVNWAIISLPTGAVNLLQPGLIAYRQRFEAKLQKTCKEFDSGKALEGRDTLFSLMVQSRRKVSQQIDSDRFFNDVVNYIVAGMEATSYVLTFATYFLLTNPACLAKMQKELFESQEYVERMDHREIMKLPYLTAVVKESLRLSNTVPGHLPRIVPASGMQIGDYHVPGGTMVSMVHPVVERSEEIFPNAHQFLPERWTGPDSHKLDKWAIAFSKGRRQCIGMNLANIQLYMIIAVFFCRFEMDLFETTAADVDIVDQFAPIMKAPVKIKILKDRWAHLYAE
ncbi:cytochrome P450 [Calycina marina]|uniref:Cytochrome P450 n=1 Tax=Calycina marina TaxID=1763456 RepID=A0A9P7YVM1_9HELO|nr:cytochrome P450 [Calycina marina]